MQNENTEGMYNQLENINLNQNFQPNFFQNLNQNYPLVNNRGFQPLSYRQFLNMNTNLLPKPYLFHHFYEQQSNSMFQEPNHYEDYSEKKEESIEKLENFREIAGDIIFSLNCVDNQKMKSSEFYQFLTKIKNGSIEIKNNQVIQHENIIPELMIQNRNEGKQEEDKLKTDNPFDYLDGFWEEMLKE